MPAPEHDAQQQPQAETPVASGVSMKDLLASCAAATAVSTPPGEADEDPEDGRPAAGRDAA
ncbi:hypothetical protein AB0D35_11450 [Streptomyces sp. NPDC048301]|uniref:hypothetical protein n=1 Tax=Streptomyces sp. NPDC048301 TaxID=3155631 RepID=UPI00341F92ED